MTTYAINGIGRIGKYVLKFLLEKNLDLAWINDAVGTINTHCHCWSLTLFMVGGMPNFLATKI